MKNSKFVFDKFTKLLEQGLVSSRDLKNEIVNILKSKRWNRIQNEINE